ncbi:MAG: GNAT family N-acetyltransferase [Hyphomicrobiaceae bacterium]|nr:GNAT family N-acetyltransferase [Hyphomicrobiaceae bacterium]
MSVAPEPARPALALPAGMGVDHLTVEALPGVGAIPEADWSRLFPGEAEGWAYYRAVEASPPPGFRLEAMTVRDAAGRLVAAAPIFHIVYRLDTPLQGGLRPLGDWLHRAVPRLVAHPVMGLGSPLADRCHLGVDASLEPGRRQRAVAALLTGLDAKAKAEGVRILAVKDLADREAAPLHDTLLAAGFARIAGLPVCVLDLPFKDEPAYIQSLSANNRSVLRRKLKTAGPVVLETVTDIAGLEDEIFSLYEETRANSRFDYGDFEQLSPAYFRECVAALGPGRAAVILARVDGRLLAMKLLFIENDRIIDKFWGMRYPAGRDHNLFFVCWMEGVRFALRHGARQYQSGQTAYAQKVKLGSRLDPMWVYFRHRWPLVNRVFRRVAPLLAFDKMDPELAEIRKREPRRFSG